MRCFNGECELLEDGDGQDSDTDSDTISESDDDEDSENSPDTGEDTDADTDIDIDTETEEDIDAGFDAGGGDGGLDTDSSDEYCTDPMEIAECWWEDAIRDGVTCSNNADCPTIKVCVPVPVFGPSVQAGQGLCACESDEDCRDGVCVREFGLCGPSYCNGYLNCVPGEGCEDAGLGSSGAPSVFCHESLPELPFCCEGLYPSGQGNGFCWRDTKCIQGGAGEIGIEFCVNNVHHGRCWWEDAVRDGIACYKDDSCVGGQLCDFYEIGPYGEGLCTCDSDGQCRQGVCGIDGICGPSYCNGFRECSSLGGCGDRFFGEYATPAEFCEQELTTAPFCCDGPYPEWPATEAMGYCSPDEDCGEADSDYPE